jgi:L-iditol 2-dehydrogenase
MKLARYHAGGVIRIEEAPEPVMPAGGLLVQTEACGLCSGELVQWYLDRKAPHVLGHEVCGRVIESDDARFPVGSRVFPHHHAPDPESALAKRGAAVHDPTWRGTRLDPGGMAERFAVAPENLADTLIVDDLRPREAALIEPLACVMKSLRRLHLRGDERVAVIGQGVMGLMFSLMLPGGRAYDLSPGRIEWAQKLGVDARHPDQAEPAEVVVVCPGTAPALELALSIAEPDPRILLFAPLPPGQPFSIDLDHWYMQDLSLICSYSCGPEDTRAAAQALREGRFRAEDVVSEFIGLDDLPDAYARMKRGETLKAMVEF